MKLSDIERDTAYHEAGHAVVACNFNRPPSLVTIIPGDDFLGRALGIDVCGDEELATIALAGVHAMALARNRRPRLAEWANGGRGDLDIYMRWMPSIIAMTGETIREAERRLDRETRLLLQHLRTELDTFAHALLDRKTLDADDIERLWGDREPVVFWKLHPEIKRFRTIWAERLNARAREDTEAWAGSEARG
jgi:hypothetical protein